MKFPDLNYQLNVYGDLELLTGIS